ncbi:hypothetical protein CBM2623_B110108 [Cupriavidus taiwanensis]|nr:hypothetical protein CBM2608_B120108 [Cupriavidus taiwanensis]SPA32051.1 hypothetical protein CBM2623_B110108 [Cupriavidus taiwanensis]
MDGHDSLWSVKVRAGAMALLQAAAGLSSTDLSVALPCVMRMAEASRIVL